MKRSTFPRVGLFVAMLACCAVVLADPPASQPTGTWKAIKSANGKVTGGKAKQIKFLVNTNHWRVNISSDIEKSSGALNGNIRIALMVETMRDSQGKAYNWKQVDVLAQGQAPLQVSREFDNGLDKDGKARWYELQITGNTANYDIKVEDQSGSPDEGKSKKRKKKSD